MAKKTIRNDWEVRGKTLKDFEDAIKQKKDSTSYLRLPPGKNVFVASIDTVNDKEVVLYHLPTDPKDVYNPFSGKKLKMSTFPRSAFEAKGITGELFEEFCNQGFGILIEEPGRNRLLFPSEWVDLAQLDIGGKFFTTQSSSRNISFAEAWSRKKEPITLVCRTEETTTKVFAIRSGKYAPIDSQNIFNVLDCFDKTTVGEAEVVKWEINNSITRLYVKFPEKAREIASMYKTMNDFVPGLIIETSDIGDCAFRIIGCWYLKNSVFYSNDVSRRHSGDVDIAKILEDVKKSIFEQYTEVPEKMVSLLSTDLEDFSLTKAQQKKRYEKFCKDISAYIDLSGAVGKKVEMSMREQIVDEFIPDQPYTAYDVVLAFLQLPERIEGQVPQSSMRKLQKAVTKAVFFDFCQDDIVLLP